MPASALSKERGIGQAKAAAVVAAFEFGAPVARKQIDAAPLDTPEQIHRYCAPQLQHLPHEQVVVVGLDTRLRHMEPRWSRRGGASDHRREVLRPAIALAAYGFVLLHNNLSGDPSPSAAQNSITKRIAEAATARPDWIAEVPPKAERFEFSTLNLAHRAWNWCTL